MATSEISRKCSGGSCSRTSSNKHFDCPPRMADGRLFTDYRPRCDVNFIRGDGVPRDSYEYRQFLMNNADGLMAAWRGDAYAGARCGPCVPPYNVGTMLPEQNRVKCDAKTCTTGDAVPFGLGQGRDYGLVPDAQFLGFKQREQQELASGANCCGGADKAYFGYMGRNNDDQGRQRQLAAGGEARWTAPSAGYAMHGGDASVAF